MNKKVFFAKQKANSVNEKNFTIDFVMTIEVPDRHGEMVDIATVNYKNFMNNPVLLAQHKHDEAPIGKITDIWEEIIDGKRALIGRAQFAVNEYELAKTYFNLYKGGFMNAVSIGFIPQRGDMVENTFVLYDSELLELSCVSIPANQLALAKSKGINVSEVIKLDKEAITKDVRENLILLKELSEELLDEEQPTATEEAETPTTPTEEAPEVVDNDKGEAEVVPTEVIHEPTPEEQRKRKYLTNLSVAIRMLSK